MTAVTKRNNRIVPFDQLEALDETDYGMPAKRHENPSGIQPTEYKVLISPKLTQEKTKGGIILPDATKERDQYAQMEGVVVAVAPLAFTYASEVEWGGHKPPKVGDTVLFAKYAGAVVTGRDGKEYRITNDKDICAVLT